MAQTFYDHFALANTSIQERLGRSATALNRDSAVFGQQTRSLLQMLSYGNDAITARAATHLLNMDVLYGNDAYLLKLAEGILLNSIRSITPPLIGATTPFRFWSERGYTRWGSLGTIGLKDGTKTNLIVYRIETRGHVEGTEFGTEYDALYCAGNYVQQTITEGFDGYTPGVFAPVYVAETYKSVWSESVEVSLVMDNSDTPVQLDLAWSLDELLGMPDNSMAVLIQHTPRGMTVTLGDGEIFGSGYNDKTGISGVTVSYVKCDSLAPVDASTIKFNSDITEIYINGMGTPLLSPLETGDTADTLRSRAVAEFFAASKITDENDLVTEVSKIPFVKSCYARREYNWSVWDTIGRLSEGYGDRRLGKDTDARIFYERYRYSSVKTYGPGDMVVHGSKVYVCSSPDYRGTPSGLNGWTFFMDLSTGASLGSVYRKYYPSAGVYDNATIVLSGLVLRSRRYWSADGSYSRGDVVYHSGTKQLWLALRDGGETVEPGSETDVSLYSDERFWASREEAAALEDESSQESDPYYNVGYKFDDYEPMTQAMFESEIKGYFNIVGKLGFTSVVVEPLAQVGVSVAVKYTSPYTLQSEIRKVIEDYVCYRVGRTLEADKLNSLLTERFGLSSVYVTIRLSTGTATDSIAVKLPSATYVPPSRLDVTLTENLGSR